MNSVLSFLKNTGENLVSGFLNPVAKLGNEVGALGEEGSALGQGLMGNQQGAQQANQSATRMLAPGGGLLHQGGVVQNNGANSLNFADYRNIASEGLNLASDVVAPGAGKAAAAGKSMAFLRGAGAGAVTNTGFGAAQQLLQNGNINPGQLAEGAALGGVLGGAGGTVGKILSDAKAAKVAQNESDSFAEKQMTPEVGPVIANRVAPAVAGTHDPNIVQNVVQNEVNKAHAPAQPNPLEGLNDGQLMERNYMDNLQTQQGEGAQLPGEGLSPEAQDTLRQRAGMSTGQPENPDEVSSYARIFGVSEDQAQTDLQQIRNPEQPKNFSGAVGELAGNKQIEEILSQGGTTTEAMNAYMEATGKPPAAARLALNNFISKDPTLNKATLNAKLNPLYGDESTRIPTVQPDHAEQAITNSRMMHNEVMRYGNNALQEIGQLSANDLKLMDDLRTTDPETLAKQAEDPDQFIKAAKATKNYNDFTHAAGAGALGQQVPYRESYGAPLLLDNSPEGQAAIQSAVTKLPQLPGYGKLRYFKDYNEAAQFGIGRRNDNFAEDISQDMQRRASDLAQLTMHKGLDEAAPGQVQVGQLGQGYKQLQIPFGSKLSMPAELADEINKRAPAPTATGGWKGYDTLNSNLKNLKLAGGGFHSVNVLGSYIGQQLASGKIFTGQGLSDLGDVIKGTFSKSGFNQTMSDLSSRGRLIDADASGLKYGEAEIGADVGQGGITGKIPVLSQIHQAIFGRQIPLLKLKIFDQQTEGLDRNLPEDMQKMQSIAKELNQNFGGINREIQGLTPRQFQIAARGFLATDYNEGQIRSLVDAFKKGGPDGKLARQVVFGKALLFGGLATAGGAAGGEFQGQTPKQVAFNILNKIANPSFTMGGYKVGLPTTQIAEVAKPLEETIKGAQTGKPAQGIENFASARLAAVPSALEQLSTNKNFYGQPIYGSDIHGRPVGAGQTALNIAGMASPIPVTQGLQTATGNESLPAAAANIAGAKVTPQYSPQYLPVGDQTYLQTEQQQGTPAAKIQADTSFFSILNQHSKARAKANTQVQTDLIHGDTQGAQKAALAYNQSLIKDLKPWALKNRQYVDNELISQLVDNPNDQWNSGLGLLKANLTQSGIKTIKRNPTKYGLQVGVSNVSASQKQ